jgi:hypothetical protein
MQRPSHVDFSLNFPHFFFSLFGGSFLPRSDPGKESQKPGDHRHRCLEAVDCDQLLNPASEAKRQQHRLENKRKTKLTDRKDFFFFFHQDYFFENVPRYC